MNSLSKRTRKNVFAVSNLKLIFMTKNNLPTNLKETNSNHSNRRSLIGHHRMANLLRLISLLIKGRMDIQKLNFNKSLKFSNLSKEKWTAHQNLKTRDDIVIKPADKGGAVVVWRTDLYKQEAFRQLADTKFYAKVNKDLTQANQKIVKDNKNCPQQPAIFSSPRLKHLHFTSNQKSTNLTTPVALSFLPAVAQQNSFPAF